MQMRRARRSVTRGTDVSNHLAWIDVHPLAQLSSIALQVSVVVTINLTVVEFVYRVSSRFAREKLADSSRHDGMHRCPGGFHDVDGFVTMAVVHFVEAVMQLIALQVQDRRYDSRLRRSVPGRIGDLCRR